MNGRKCARALLVTALLCLPARVHAQGAGRSMDLPQSVRAEGMGGAGVAVPWGVVSPWDNPATLGYQTGWSWAETRQQLVPGLATDVWFRTKRMSAGFGGLGVSWTGQPGGVGDVDLDYGVSEATDIEGNPLGSFGSFERVRGWGFGVSLARTFDTVKGRTGAQSLARYGDVAFGEYFKDCTVSLAPAAAGGSARATNRDWGVLARVSPSALLRHGADGVWDADVAFGHSKINSQDRYFTFVNEDVRSLPSQVSRNGVAVHLSLAQPTAMHMAFAHLPVLSALGPFVRVTYAHDSDVADANGSSSGEWKVQHDGIEVSFLGVVDLRSGHWTDKLGEIDGATRGIGFCLPLGKVAEFRWDYAETPQAKDSGLEDVKHRGWSMWVNPAEIWRRGGK
ncbi:MAG: hypothetical protein U0704_15645 [Candidatus Eisenbacteria bacterium]